MARSCLSFFRSLPLLRLFSSIGVFAQRVRLNIRTCRPDLRISGGIFKHLVVPDAFPEYPIRGVRTHHQASLLGFLVALPADVFLRHLLHLWRHLRSRVCERIMASTPCHDNSLKNLPTSTSTPASRSTPTLMSAPTFIWRS